METATKNTTEEIFTVGNFLLLSTNSNSPYSDIVDIIKVTEKAVQLKGENGGTAWVPKSALDFYGDRNNPMQSKWCTFKMWFRKADDGKAIKAAFRIFR